MTKTSVAPTPEENPIESAMDLMTKKDWKTTPIQFFTAWQIPHSIIAERLRRLGYPTRKEEVDRILSNGIGNLQDDYKLRILMMEMRNDIIKTLY